MELTQLKIDVSGGIATVVNNRPDKMNALNTRFFQEMDYFLDNLSEDIKIIIITGEGKAFVAGADISEMCGKSVAQGEEFSKLGQSVFDKIEQLEIPVIAAINGFALGGGCELAMACDFRIASDKAKFGQPEVNLGIIPGYAGTQRMSRLVGLGNALYLIMTADIISADEAKNIGLVQKVTSSDDLMEETLKIANNILSKGPNAIKMAKMVTRNGLQSSFADGCNLEAKKFGELFGTDAIEGMTAFLEKRKANF